MSAIVAKELTKRFPKQLLASVDQVSFEIGAGESVAFLGPNGAGKSTTIKMLCGILAPTSGSARILGSEPGTRDANISLGLVFGTRSHLYLHMTVEQCLRLSGEIYYLSPEEVRKRIIALADWFDLHPLLKKRVRELSLGQRMRCEMAAALVHRPKIVLADEPTIGLDVVAKNQLRKLLQTWLKEDRSTLLLTSHDLSDVESLCTRSILIDHGKIKFDGALKALKGPLANVRRAKVIPQDPDFSPFQKFLISSGEGTHLYEWNINEIGVGDFLQNLWKHYQDQLQDIEISEVSLEEVLARRYG